MIQPPRGDKRNWDWARHLKWMIIWALVFWAGATALIIKFLKN